jgi:uncharacterized protein
MNNQIPPEFWQGVEQFNQQQYYDCHDTLEALWIEAEEPDKKFYQGVLQISVGCYHLSNHNWRGAVILLGEGINRINYYQPHYHHIDVTQLIDYSQQLLIKLQQILPENIAEFFTEIKESKNPSMSLPKIVIIEE